MSQVIPSVQTVRITTMAYLQAEVRVVAGSPEEAEQRVLSNLNDLPWELDSLCGELDQGPEVATIEPSNDLIAVKIGDLLKDHRQPIDAGYENDVEDRKDWCLINENCPEEPGLYRVITNCKQSQAVYIADEESDTWVEINSNGFIGNPIEVTHWREI